MFGFVWSAQMCHLCLASPSATTDHTRKRTQEKSSIILRFIFRGLGHRSYTPESQSHKLAPADCLRHNRVLMEATATSGSGKSNVAVASRYRVVFIVVCQLCATRVIPSDSLHLDKAPYSTLCKGVD